MSSSSNGDSYQARMDKERKKFFPKYNKIQDLLQSTNSGEQILLPRFAVVGSQSSGKSSVLEGLVGQAFLPKGTGIVTRCPIIIRQVNSSPSKKTWAEFAHIPNQKFKDFKEVEEEIKTQTNSIAGLTTNISKNPITITVYSPNVLPFTAVDLPGIVRVADKNQSENLPELVEEFIMDFIRADPNTIILAVCKGDYDFGNAESLKIAKLSLGLVGVINRSQDDIDANKSFEDVMKSEKEFLKMSYPTISGEHGITVLAQKLNRILGQRNAEICPDLMVSLHKKL